MSYDLLVFDKRRTPTIQSDFLDWHNRHAEEEDERIYTDPTTYVHTKASIFMENLGEEVSA